MKFHDRFQYYVPTGEKSLTKFSHDYYNSRVDLMKSKGCHTFHNLYNGWAPTIFTKDIPISDTINDSQYSSNILGSYC